MSNRVSVSEKRVFIDWFLERYQLQNREAAWLLRFLSSKEELLKHVHFVEKPTRRSRTLILSTTCHPMQSGAFIHHQWGMVDIETVFNDICLFPNDDWYISLYFQGRETSPEYAAILEGNPMEKQGLREGHMLSLFAEMILDEAVREYEVNQLYDKINQALESGDKEAFLQLSEQWRKRLE